MSTVNHSQTDVVAVIVNDEPEVKVKDCVQEGDYKDCKAGQISLGKRETTKCLSTTQ